MGLSSTLHRLYLHFILIIITTPKLFVGLCPSFSVSSYTLSVGFLAAHRKASTHAQNIKNYILTEVPVYTATSVKTSKKELHLKLIN